MALAARTKESQRGEAKIKAQPQAVQPCHQTSLRRENLNAKSPDDKRAIALQYKTAQDAPIVVGNERGVWANKLIELAKQLGVPVEKNADLIELLGHLSSGSQIPEEAFLPVAEVLFFLFEANQEFKAPSVDNKTQRNI